MQRATLIFIFSLFPLTFAFSSSPIAQFVFVTEPQVVAPSASSDEFTVEAQDTSGNPIKGHTVCLEFTSSSSSGDFSTNESWSESFKTLILTLGTNQYRRNLFYKDSSLGIHTISVKAALRPEGNSCPGMSPEEWEIQWTATQKITVSPEPEQSSSTGQNTPETSVSEPAPSSSSKSIVIPSIKADAGADRTVVAGSLVELKGNALGLNDEPLENARFWWNLGDGNSIEGRAILHTFRVPGTYTVGLHISSGGYASSDYLTVSAVPNQLEIKGVTFGEDGYIRLVNKGKTEIDFGGWVLQDASGKNFVIPVKTIISPQAEIALLNSVTGLFLGGGGTLAVKYPNGREALRWSKAVVLSDNPVKHSVSNTMPVQSDADPVLGSSASKYDDEPVKEESEPKSKELASAVSAGGGTSWVFLVLALALSIAASVGFLLFRIYGKT